MLFKVILILVVGLLLFIIYVWYLEKTSVFYPDKNLVTTPNQLGLTYEDVFLKTQDNVLIHGWYISGKRNNKTVLIFHGNAGNIGDRLGKIDIFYALGLNVFVIDYRGYGKSQGSPTEEGIYLDALAAYDYLINTKNCSQSDIIVYGASLGGAVAVDLVSKKPVKALIIDSSFTNAKDIAKLIYPFVPSFLIKTKLDSLSKIKNIDVPKLFFHSGEDKTIPIFLGRNLFDAALPPKEFVELRGGHDEGHSASLNLFIDALAKFIKKI